MNEPRHQPLHKTINALCMTSVNGSEAVGESTDTLPFRTRDTLPELLEKRLLLGNFRGAKQRRPATRSHTSLERLKRKKAATIAGSNSMSKLQFMATQTNKPRLAPSHNAVFDIKSKRPVSFPTKRHQHKLVNPRQSMEICPRRKELLLDNTDRIRLRMEELWRLKKADAERDEPPETSNMPDDEAK